MSDHTKRNLFFEALSGQQRNAIGCQKIGGTYSSMIKAFRRVYDVSMYDSKIAQTINKANLLTVEHASSRAGKS